MNHFTVVDALSEPNSAMTKRVVQLAQSVNAMNVLTVSCPAKAGTQDITAL